eukprot:GHVT01081801.1.p1 GENE.GHVT01081801.1~~GHVT01081801.1.p1  ORF type:complete len:181 (-),score=49.65 GHVT01081801.1:554-1096(-)
MEGVEAKGADGFLVRVQVYNIPNVSSTYSSSFSLALTPPLAEDCWLCDAGASLPRMAQECATKTLSTAGLLQLFPHPPPSSLNCLAPPAPPSGFLGKNIVPTPRPSYLFNSPPSYASSTPYVSSSSSSFPSFSSFSSSCFPRPPLLQHRLSPLPRPTLLASDDVEMIYEDNNSEDVEIDA